MDKNHFKGMTDEQLVGALESNANAARSAPGGSLSAALVMDEAARRLAGGSAEEYDEPADDTSPEAAAYDAKASTPSYAGNVTTTETLKGE